MYSHTNPTPVSAPTVTAYSVPLAKELGFSDEMMKTKAAAAVLAGNKPLEGMKPFAACYGGHQFGHWAGQLGDGRAISLGELQNIHQQRLELQLKGAGPTPYSRSADGRAVMRSSLREFLMSEAMHHLGIPTTRALSLVATGDSITRDMLYDGNPKPEPGAIVCRVAPSFLRFGSFEIFSARYDHENLKLLADYAMTEFFPELGKPNKESYAEWLAEISRRTASLMAEWMRVGFVHGVMNTDNMSILGLTIDYGPYGWIDNYDSNWTPNTTDAQGRRYRFGNQPHIGLWNVERLAEALMPLIDDKDLIEHALDEYIRTYQDAQSKTYRCKLGLADFRGEDDIELFQQFFTQLKAVETDMTIFFRNLAKIDIEETDGDKLLAPLMDAYYEAPSNPVKEKMVDWLNRYQARCKSDGHGDQERQSLMNQTNPKYVLRNYLAQMAIDKVEAGDTSLLNTFLDLFQHPYDEQAEHEVYFAKRPEWARNKVGCSMLSCSS